MLGKLLKYDLKWVLKAIVIFYILALIFAILTRLFLSIDNSLLYTVIGKIFNGAMISMLVSSLINSLMRSWVRFIHTIYKDESYLTHTLPVEKKSIYLSKVLTGIITSFLTIIIAIICIFIAYYSKTNMEMLKQFLKLAANTYNTTVISLILTISVVIFLETLFIILIGYNGIIIGHKSNKNKMLRTVFIGLVLYFATSLLTLGIVYIIGLFNTGVMNIINTTEIVNFDAIKSVMLIGIAIYLVYNIIYYLIGRIEFNKGVNVD